MPFLAFSPREIPARILVDIRASVHAIPRYSFCLRLANLFEDIRRSTPPPWTTNTLAVGVPRIRGPDVESKVAHTFVFACDHCGLPLTTTLVDEYKQLSASSLMIMVSCTYCVVACAPTTSCLKLRSTRLNGRLRTPQPYYAILRSCSADDSPQSPIFHSCPTYFARARVYFIDLVLSTKHLSGRRGPR